MYNLHASLKIIESQNAMRMTGDQRIAAPRQKVWDALNDPVILKQCIPGCQSLERESATRMKATVTIKLGPISARFTGVVTFSEIDPPNGYTISGEGQGGAAGSAKGSAKVRLADDAGATRLSYDVDAQVGGRLAQLGGPVIDATAKQLAGLFFKKFGEVVASETPPGATPASPRQSVKSTERTSSPASPAISPVLQFLAIAVTAVAAFLIGHAGGGTASNWIGLSTALFVVIVAASAFALGRRSATHVITLDADTLERLRRMAGDKK